LKATVENILSRLGVNHLTLSLSPKERGVYSKGLQLMTKSGKLLGSLGIVNRSILKSMDIEQEVYYAELGWKALLREGRKKKTLFTEIPKFPEVKRDLALLLDKDVSFDAIKKVAFESERNLLKRVTLFDVYEGKNLPSGKKSYAVSFFLQDIAKTLTDKQIDLIMSKIQTNLETKLSAQQR
jgi:phenylalanyl-tRNA synthetase beta chain